jgi:hypothetical protein
VQNADVDPRCEPSKSAQLQKAINIATLGASETITDFVLDDDFSVRPSPPNPGIDWSIDYVTDDVAGYQLPVTVAQPSCSLARSVVRRGRALSISCNFTGSLNVPLPPRFARSRQGHQARRHGQGARIDREPVARALQRVDDQRPARGARGQALDRPRALTLSTRARGAALPGQ